MDIKVYAKVYFILIKLYIMDELERKIIDALEKQDMNSLSGLVKSLSMMANFDGIVIYYVTFDNKDGKIVVPKESEDYQRLMNAVAPTSMTSSIEKMLRAMMGIEEEHMEPQYEATEEKEEDFEIIPKGNELFVVGRAEEEPEVRIESGVLDIGKKAITLPPGNWKIVEKKFKNGILTIHLQKG
jgi:HSP20 family molecular chaperone IbpA